MKNKLWAIVCLIVSQNILIGAPAPKPKKPYVTLNRGIQCKCDGGGLNTPTACKLMISGVKGLFDTMGRTLVELKLVGYVNQNGLDPTGSPTNEKKFEIPLKSITENRFGENKFAQETDPKQLPATHGGNFTARVLMELQRSDGNFGLIFEKIMSNEVPIQCEDKQNLFSI